MELGAEDRRRDGTAIGNRVIYVLATAVWLVANANIGRGDTLLDDKWADGSRYEANRPAEAEVWVGREQDVTVAAGALSSKMGETSQKIWTYFTDEKPIELATGQKLVVSVAFIPREALATTTSRSFRLGVFHDPTNPRVEYDVNNDGGGPDAPWTDAEGYAVQVLITGGEGSYTSPLDLGKRTNLTSRSLLGTSGDYTKQSGGRPVTMQLDQEYRVVLEIKKVSETQLDLTASLHRGEEELSTSTISDNGSALGTSSIADHFDFLFLRISDGATTADQIDFTSFKVELLSAPAEQ